MTTFIAIPDLQVPDHDQKAVDLVCRVIEDIQPDVLLCVGDEADSPEPARWNKGMAMEYSLTLQKGLDQTHDVLAQFRNALGDKPFHLMRSNHTDRIRHYIAKYAPALASLRELEYTRLIRIDELDITWHDKPYEFAKGWLLAHGDEGPLSRIPASTSMGLARRWGKSVLAGHTHRLGIQHDHATVNGRVVRHLFGVEAGHLMSLSKAHYLKAGSGNWQQGIVLIEGSEGSPFTPITLPIINRTLTYGGQTWK